MIYPLLCNKKYIWPLWFLAQHSQNPWNFLRDRVSFVICRISPFPLWVYANDSRWPLSFKGETGYTCWRVGGLEGWRTSIYREESMAGNEAQSPKTLGMSKEWNLKIEGVWVGECIDLLGGLYFWRRHRNSASSL